MCGRFTLTVKPETIAKQFELAEPPELEPRYNIAPSQAVPVVRVKMEAEERILEMMRWGLIPGWAKDPSIGNKLINARAETAAEKPAFRSAFRKRRCLVVADGFYEWQVVPGKKQKQPFYFRLRDGLAFGFAGLWDRSQAGDGTVVESCTIITMPANALMATVHNGRARMPAILARDDRAKWLSGSPAEAHAALQPYADGLMVAYRVGSRVNSPRNNDASLLEPLPEPAAGAGG